MEDFHLVVRMRSERVGLHVGKPFLGVIVSCRILCVGLLSGHLDSPRVPRDRGPCMGLPCTYSRVFLPFSQLFN